MDVTDRQERYCVIGAGPAGLAMAAALARHGVPYDHLERHASIGGIWDLNNPGTPVYSTTHLISSKTLSGFLDFPMPDVFPDYPRRDQILSYLRTFARHHGVADAIELGRHVERVVPSTEHADVTVDGETRRYRGVVCASGINWEPAMPELPPGFSGQVRHSQSYRYPSELEGKRVLILGLGNTAADVACDAVRTAQSVCVSVRRGYYFVPKHVFGKPADVFAHEGPQLPLWLEIPIFGWIQRLLVGDQAKLGMPKPDHRILECHPLMNDQLLHHLRHGDVELEGKITGFEGNTVRFEGGGSREVDVLLCCTGYTRRIAYLDAEHLDGGTWAAGQFLTCFSRKYPSLFTVGFAEINGALFPHLSRFSELIARVAKARLHAPGEASRFFQLAGTLDFDLTGGRRLIDSERHAHYCDDAALLKSTRRVFARMGWPCPSAAYSAGAFEAAEACEQ